MESPFDEEELQLLYSWVDEIPLSRPKKNIARDFSDGVMMAEVVKHFFPKLVDLHNYSSTSSSKQKIYNWNTLDQKVFQKIGFSVDPKEIDDMVKCKPFAAERMLKTFQIKVTQIQQRKATQQVTQPTKPATSNTSKDSIPSSSASSRVITKRPASASSVRTREQSRPSSAHINHMDAVSHHSSRARNRDHFLEQQPPIDDETLYNNKQHMNMPVFEESELIKEKDAKIHELEETVKLLESKINKLQLLIRLKDSKIQALSNKI
ncbi:hypothetical protein NAEGRDRAFT_3580, partial [Naegleria gruberi]